jgi:hypothetical protein
MRPVAMQAKAAGMKIEDLYCILLWSGRADKSDFPALLFQTEAGEMRTFRPQAVH